jgi:hypothetical protein
MNNSKVRRHRGENPMLVLSDPFKTYMLSIERYPLNVPVKQTLHSPSRLVQPSILLLA